MSAILATILPALFPAVADGIRGLIGKFFGTAGAAPKNVDEAVRLYEAETAKLSAIAKLDQAGVNISPWVADLRASCRYIMGYLVLIASLLIVGFDPKNPALDVMLQLSGSVIFFFFGDRVYLNLKKGSR